jgi:hypothetical protein
MSESGARSRAGTGTGTGTTFGRARRLRLVVASACLGWLLLGLAGPALAASPLAASPDPSPGGGYGGDTRTAGQGPGLVGSPLYAVGAVLLVALVSIGLTQVYLRLTPAPPPIGQSPGSRPPGQAPAEPGGPARGQ